MDLSIVGAPISALAKLTDDSLELELQQGKAKTPYKEVGGRQRFFLSIKKLGCQLFIIKQKSLKFLFAKLASGRLELKIMKQFKL